jgi:hypothetical protein
MINLNRIDLRNIPADLDAFIQQTWNWIDVDDLNIRWKLPNAIAIAEQWLSRRLNVLDMQNETTFPVSTGEIDLPARFKAVETLWREGATVHVHYLEHVEPLSETNMSNWLLAKYPDLLQYATLFRLAPFFPPEDTRPEQEWKPRMEELLQQVIEDDERARLGRSSAYEARKPHTGGPDGSYTFMLPEQFRQTQQAQTRIPAMFLPGYYTVSLNKIRVYPTS